jgi:hypothetical protein
MTQHRQPMARSMTLRAITTALSTLCVALLVSGCDRSATPGGDLTALHPDVRAAVLRAREAEKAAEDAAQRARDAAAKGQAAADRARRGEAGVIVGPVDSEGRQYEGEADANGTPLGFGVFYWSAGTYRGDKLAGEFGDGTRARPGVYQYGDNDNPNARAALRYEGDFLNGQRNGYGVTYWRDGARTKSLLRDSGSNGPGVYVHLNGTRYEGDFEQGLPSGHGAEWGPNGELTLQGLWLEGSLSAALAP